MCFTRCCFRQTSFSAVFKAALIAASLQVGLTGSAAANDDLLRSMLGVAGAIVQNDGGLRQGDRSRVQNVQYSEPRLTPDQIFALQVRLNDMGFQTGTPDGGLGRNTRRGIRQWQAATGRPATGYLSNDQASFLLQGADAIIRAAGSDNQLLPSEVQQLQRRLNELGYDVGQPDGVAGPRTDRALARYLRDGGHDPARVSARSALGMMTEAHTARAATRSSPSGPPVQAAARPDVDVAAIDFERVILDRGNANRDLTRMMVAARPQLLDDPQNLSNIFRLEGNRHSSSYRIDEELASFKIEYQQTPVPERVYVTLVDSYAMERSKYIRDRGIFPFRSVSLGTERFGRYTDVQSSVLRGATINLHIPNLPVLNGVPMTLEEAEEFEKSFRGANEYFVQVEASVEISGLNYRHERGLFEADARVFSVQARPLGKRRGRDPLFVWPIEESEVGAAAEVMAGSATSLPGVVETDGHIDIVRLGDVGAFAASLMLASHPGAVDDDILLAAAGKSLLPRETQLEIWRGNEPDEWGRGRLREDERRSVAYFASAIRERYMGALAARVADTNIRIVETLGVTLGDPTEDKQAVPLIYDHNPAVSMRDPYDFAQLEWSHPGVVMPRTLPLDGDLSRALIQRYGERIAGHKLHLAIYSEIREVRTRAFDVRRGFYSVELEPTVTRIALFFDRGLQDLAYDFYEGADGGLLAQQREQDLIATLLAEGRTSVDALHAAYGQLARDTEYLPQIASDAIRQRDINEFDRADARRDLLASLDADRAGQGLVFDWEMRLGTYDMDRGAFAVLPASDNSSVGSLSFAGSDQGLELGSLRVEIVNQPKWLAVPRAAARRFVERAEADDRRRVVRAIARADAVSARSTVDRHDRKSQHLGVYVRSMVLLAPDSDSVTGWEILAEIDYGAYRAAEIDNVAEAGHWDPTPLLDQEMAAVVSVRIGNADFADADLRRLYADRWLREQGRGFPTSSTASIFNGSDQIPTVTEFEKSRDSFLQWMGTLAEAELPDVAHIRMALPGWGGQRLKAGQCSDMRAVTGGSDPGDINAVKSALGLSLWDYESELSKQMGRGAQDKPAILENVMFTFVYPSVSDCAVPEAADAARSMAGGQESMGWSVYLLVDRLPIPRNYAQDGYSYGTLEFSIEDVSPLKTEDGSGGVIVRGSFKDVSYAKQDDGSEGAGAVRWSTSDIVRESIDLDILGMRLGMSEAEGDKRARAHLGQDVIVLKSRPDRSPAVPAFTDVVFYLKADLSERIALFYEEGKGSREILAVQRIVSSPNWALPRDQVAKGLISKYGDPVHADYGQSQTVLTWGPGAGAYECQRFDNGGELIQSWMDEDGNAVSITDYMDWNLARDSKMAYVPEPFNPEATRHCLGILLADQNSNRLSTLLVDPAEYISAWRATQTLNEARSKAPTSAADASGDTSLGIRF